LILLRTAKRELIERVDGGMQMTLGEVQIDLVSSSRSVPHQ